MNSKPQNDPINRGTISDQVFNFLSKAILSGGLKPDERLIEADIADRLGISRGPVREALVELERQGLATSEARKGAFVKPWGKDDLWEVATLRATLEALAAKLATPHIQQDDMNFLENLVEKMKIAEHEDNIEELIDLDFAFHGRMIERCQHKRLQKVLGNMKLQIRLFRIVTRPTDFVSYPEMHQTLIDALREKDAEHAQQAVYDHIMETAEAALASLTDEEHLSINLGGRNREILFTGD